VSALPVHATLQFSLQEVCLQTCVRSQRDLQPLPAQSRLHSFAPLHSIVQLPPAQVA
jgi:hypothetical protein